MITYKDAFDIAKEMFPERGYQKVVKATDLQDKWVFTAVRHTDNRPDYGNCSISVNKEDGKAVWYNQRSSVNISEFIRGTEIPLPA